MSPMEFDRERALELLRVGTEDRTAEFREDQEEAIHRIVSLDGRLLVVQKTGWGKSFVYFIATKLLREAGMGPSILVSPLLSLMRNQIAAAERMGLEARTINSDNEEAWNDVEAEIEAGEVDTILISPERFANERFRERVLAEIAGKIPLLIVDEAHCVSDWGHDFRPHYRFIERIVSALPANTRVLATTATANDRVVEDLHDVLGPNLSVVRGELTRDSLTLQSVRLEGQAERLAWLAERLGELGGSGIVYALTIRDAQIVTDWLRAQGMAVATYSSREEDRPGLERALLNNELKALVSTTALGMGFDKPDLAFVIHYQMPASVVHYYQQVGLAGRGIENAYGVLLHGEGDEEILQWFIDSAFPEPEEVESVLDALEAEENGLSVPQLQQRVNIGKTRLERVISMLSLESPAPIVKEDRKWQLAAADLSDAFWERARRLTDLRAAELEQMKEYAALPFGEHMTLLVGALDGDVTGIDAPRLPALPTEASTDMVIEAQNFLKRTSLPIEPRKQWPAGGLPGYGVQGRIAEDERAEIGRALCRWGDAGWGGLVRDGKYQAGHFSDDLVQACQELLDGWAPDPAPRWVTCVPSPRHPRLVPDFAHRLAEALDLPFLESIYVAEERPAQKSMNNAIRQAANLDGALGVHADLVRPDPVLLVDDMVDSRWTLTVCAWLLRTHGSGTVWPLALGDTGSGA